ncbi:MAG: hypothetical protein U0271_28765 [Polyangiaceae bacterium]
MRPREVFFLIDLEGAVLFEEASDSAIAIPDARARWQRIWELRDRLSEISHSHPLGPLGFSEVDDTTMEAIDSALGRRLTFSVVAPDGMVRREPDGKVHAVRDEPAWTSRMRALSGMTSTPDDEPNDPSNGS